MSKPKSSKKGATTVLPAFLDDESATVRYALHLMMSIDEIIRAGRLLKALWKEQQIDYNLSHISRVQVRPPHRLILFARDHEFHRLLQDNGFPVSNFWRLSVKEGRSTFVSPTIILATIQLGNLYELELWSAQQASVRPVVVFHFSKGSDDWLQHRAPMTHTLKKAVLRKAFSEVKVILPKLKSSDKCEELVRAMNKTRTEIGSGTSGEAQIWQVHFSTPAVHARDGLVSLYEQVSHSRLNRVLKRSRLSVEKR